MCVMTAAHLASIHTGPVAPLGPDGVPSGFVKQARSGAVAVGPLGLAGDVQADLRVHGGPEKAVYAYAASHYPAWRAEFPEHAMLWAGGGVGENFSVEGLDESALCVGDIHEIGSAVLQVCQPRRPCFKFALRFGDSRLPGAMVRSGRSGWYYRVLEPGIVRAGDSFRLRERLNSDFAFERLVSIVYGAHATPAELERLAGMAGLAGQWRQRAREVLSSAGKSGSERVA
jgi:MOSC domain-containing protein YiiM